MTRELFTELRSDESVSWVMTINQLSSPGLALVTTQRLLVLPLIPGKRIRQAASPFRVELGKQRRIGQVVEVVNEGGAAVSLLLSTGEDVSRLLAAAGTGGPSPTPPPPPDEQAPQQLQQPQQPQQPRGFQASSNGAPGASGPHGASASGTAGPLGSWRWSRVVLSWQDAEQLAADHMRHLKFGGVLASLPGRDGGLDVVAHNACAQVKFHTASTGSPDIQRLVGAGDAFAHKLFYAIGYTTTGLAQADVLGIALFQYDHDGTVVPVNEAARDLGGRTPDPAPKRTIFGQLDFEGRQIRVLRWAEQVEVASRKPISNRQRKGAKQLAEREQALRLVVSAYALLKDSNNPLYKRRRRERTLQQAEKSIKEAARVVRVILI